MRDRMLTLRDMDRLRSLGPGVDSLAGGGMVTPFCCKAVTQGVVSICQRSNDKWRREEKETTLDISIRGNTRQG